MKRLITIAVLITLTLVGLGSSQFSSSTALASSNTTDKRVATVHAVAPTTAAARTAYINTLYRTVVPAGERTALASRYTLGYNLSGISCGTGCTKKTNGRVQTSFNAEFFRESVTLQRNRIAHEAAHAYGFLFFTHYSRQSWSALGGWQAQFNRLDRGFVRSYDAEAFAACVAWKETGYNNRVDQIRSVCTPQAAAFAIAQIKR